MGVSYLLDTHAFIWLTDPLTQRGNDVRRVLLETAEDVYVSAVSAFEVATKTRLGRLAAEPLLDAWDHTVTGLGAKPLPLSAEHARTAGLLAWEHRDPFDRLLVVQAEIEELTLVTADTAILAGPASRLLPWS